MILAASALAAPVICDPDLAERLLVDARIDIARVPVTHPWLLPGLARRSADPATVAAVERLCAPGGDLFVERAESSEQPDFKAYTIILSRSRFEPGSCALVHERVPISVGVGQGPPVYRLRGELPLERTPAEGCAEPAEWREERLLDAEGVVRMVLAIDHRGEEIVRSHVAIRAASRQGWDEVILRSPAPPRSLGEGASGPILEMAEDPREGQVLVALTHDRKLRTEGPRPRCEPIGGQIVWQIERSSEGSEDTGTLSIRELSGRDALAVIARAGLWQLAGDDGWLLILAQDDEEDQFLSQDGEEQRTLVYARVRRLQRRDPEPLYVLSSSDFPGLNAGFLVITPGPWSSEGEAREARSRWTRSAGSSIRQAWEAIDPCEMP